MGIMDKIKGLVTGHEDKVREGVDKAAEMADKRTGGKYGDQIRTGKEKLGEQLGTQRPPQEGDEPQR
ncbi:antitoxin [Streptomyces griseoaurantiacus]|uniref:MT0933-like antitoxin protein n=2 Tax=Streptoalloteichus tenebrarius (strain ATCC 17920 / DSM 40477 / JCM 4838 / CBS 697.72 / NBRC 16177 / NCIMB 11028 / NRRL B-12390 / A12253. 1 / ISP 5477) TaxID=1933 RepID=A0ABT1HV16_STRSD|nr:MT0933-like antitoxin protein [Streptoalloteichus tenebrarius]GHE85567.1 hypothetical protein GCM10018782_65640 [Streptomyces griseoaurantiacus]